jgi:negative regulator of sigma E activity
MRLQIIQNAVNGVDMRRRQLILAVDEIRLDNYVFLAPKSGLNLRIDTLERLTNVLTSVISAD